MGRPPSGLVLLTALCCCCLAADDCTIRGEEWIDFPKCLSDIMIECKSELPTGEHLFHSGRQDVHFTGGGCGFIAGSVIISNVALGELLDIGLFEGSERMSMSMSFRGTFSASIFADFLLCGTPNICNKQACQGYPVTFNFTGTNVEKISYWRPGQGDTLKQQRGNPKPDIGLFPTRPLVYSLTSSHSAFKDLSKENLAKVAPKNLIGTLQTAVGDMYNNLLEKCVFPNVSGTVKYEN